MHKLTSLSLLLAGALSSVLAIDGTRVNGYVVTPHYWAGWASCCACNPPARAGHILLTTVQNGSPTRIDTIYNRTLGLGYAPQFDIEGKRVAFYRSGTAASANGLSCATVNGGTSYVSVIDRNGSNLRNLVALRTSPYDEMMMAWPAGNWIYYINPRTDAWGGRSTEIRKVNVQTSQDEFVWQDSDTENWFRRFTLSADGTRMAQQRTPNGSNNVAAFPSMTGICGAAGCNAAVSPSGQILASYFGGLHTDLMLTKVDGCSGLGFFSLQANAGVGYRGNVEGWAGNTNLFNGSEGCELIRWSVNSDKWILQDVGWCGHASRIEGGSNPVACNFIDKVSFMVTSNARVACLPANPDQIRTNDFTGSMWVDGGAENAGKWEDTLGVWHAIPGYDPTSSAGSPLVRQLGSPLVLRSSSTIALAGQGAYRSQLIDSRGRCIRLTQGIGSVTISTTALHTGAYILRTVRKGSVTQSRFVVGQ